MRNGLLSTLLLIAGLSALISCVNPGPPSRESRSEQSNESRAARREERREERRERRAERRGEERADARPGERTDYPYDPRDSHPDSRSDSDPDYRSRSGRHARVDAGPGEFDYYLLAMTWAPNFCAQHPNQQSSRECGSGRHLGFVVHGLWPQLEAGRLPQGCGSASPVAESIVQQMLNYMPDAGLIQHEWRDHGTCSGLSASEFFAAVRKAADSVQIPQSLKSFTSPQETSPPQIEKQFAAANASFPKEAFRTACGGGTELGEVRVCFTKDLVPRACSASAGECRAQELDMLPPR